MLRRLLRGRSATDRHDRGRADLDADAICGFCSHRARWHIGNCTHDRVQLRLDCPCPGFAPSGFRSTPWPGVLPATLLPEELCAACEHRYTFHDLELAIVEYGAGRSLLENNPTSCYYDDASIKVGCECNGWSRSGRVAERSVPNDDGR